MELFIKLSVGKYKPNVKIIILFHIMVIMLIFQCFQWPSDFSQASELWA